MRSDKMAEIIINYVAVLGAAIADMVLGFLWYGLLFSKKWMELMKIDLKKMEGMKKGMGKKYAVTFISSLVMAFVLAHFVDFASAGTAMQGAQVGFWAWLGFIATQTLGSVLWEGKSEELYFLNNAYHLISLLVMGVILAVWV